MLEITAYIFLTIGVGYLSVSCNIIRRESVPVLTSFAIYIALPALIFKSTSERAFAEILHLDYLAVYATASLVTFLLVYFYSKRLAGNDMTSASIFAMGGSFSNSLMIGYPVLLGLFGEAALVPLALCLLVENFVIMPLTLALGDIGRQHQKTFFHAFLATLPGLARNPIILSIIFGLLFSLFNLQTPGVVSKVVDLFAASAPAIALFSIGGLLVGSKIVGLGARIGPVLFAKLIVHPVLVALLIMAFPNMDPMLKSSAVIMAAMPMFASYPVIGQRYELGSISASLLVVTTIASFITINLVVWVMAS